MISPYLVVWSWLAWRSLGAGEIVSVSSGTGERRGRDDGDEARFAPVVSSASGLPGSSWLRPRSRRALDLPVEPG